MSDQRDIQRRVGNFKPGDIARVVKFGAAMCGFDLGDIVEIQAGYDPNDGAFALMVQKYNDELIGFCDAEHLQRLVPEEG